MEIKVDAEAKKVITSLCDVALKSGGIANLVVVQQVILAMEVPVAEPLVKAP